MSSQDKAATVKLQQTIKPNLSGKLRAFAKKYWIGTVIILIATSMFFWPMITRVSSYSEGGDMMFNAWTLSRDYHCILRENCPNYLNGNIFFPNKDTMLYSETQLSAGILTLPLYFINSNPLFSYNIATIASFFMSGWLMYLLVKRLSKNHEVISVFSALAFEFAPVKIAAFTHLQNLSIFYLPLILLAIIKFLDTRSRKYLLLLFVSAALLFYASWYQMIFALIAIGIFLIVTLLTKMIPWRKFLIISAVLGAAALSTLPLALQYTKFSSENSASFSITDQAQFSSSVADYFMPDGKTIAGDIYKTILPHKRDVAYDTDSYSYLSVILVVNGGFVTIASYLLWRKNRGVKKKAETSLNLMAQSLAFAAISVVGVVFSFGPLVKLKSHFVYGSLIHGFLLAIPAPWLLISLYVPQLSFIRAIGRISVIALFGLCCLLALLPVLLKELGLSSRARKILLAIVCLMMIVELMPLQQVPMSSNSFSYNISIPPIYKYISRQPKIDDIIVLRSQNDYPGAPFPVVRVEDVMWAGYDNKNIFNGYSGYQPPQYGEQYADFVDLKPDDIGKMKQLGLRYVIIDRLLTPPNSELRLAAASLLGKPIYSDSRYTLYAL